MATKPTPFIICYSALIHNRFFSLRAIDATKKAAARVCGGSAALSSLSPARVLGTAAAGIGLWLEEESVIK